MLDGFKAVKQTTVETSDGHKLHVEESGYLDGIPALYVHGGPGAGIGDNYNWPFAGKGYRLIAFDQRGCGRSAPSGCLDSNNITTLLNDIEQIRQHFDIDKWLLFGGSWGSTLSLAYAIKFPHHVSAMVLRGVFLGRPQDVDWFISADGGAAQVFKNEYTAFVGNYELTNSETICKQFYRDLTSNNRDVRINAAERWYNWEGSISQLSGVQRNASDYATSKQSYILALFECHYLINHCFISQNYILENAHKIAHIPCHIIHGRYDMICKCEAAVALHESLDNATLRIIEAAGHSMIERGIGQALVEALESTEEALQNQ
ncbi:MAG: prolyl aminopeptidase [Glaciecola sp.]